ncbi:MAG: hypothetical protein HYV35_00590 [Lentisphaerae bacterium]|nr:hypothetical protein [Lentisphaerota bacterium]
MADIQLICSACGKAQTVSEYVQERELECPACGKPLTLADRKPVKISLDLKRSAPPPPHEGAVPGAPGAPAIAPVPAIAGRSSIFTAQDIRSVQAHKRKVWLAAFVFLALAGLLAYLRFFSSWPFLPQASLKFYGKLAIACAYLLIIGLALRDNMFDGLLAIVVPLYPFYYLFFLSGAVFLRALVGALLAVFGYDTLIVLQAWAIQVTDAVNKWIERMGS